MQAKECNNKATPITNIIQSAHICVLCGTNVRTIIIIAKIASHQLLHIFFEPPKTLLENTVNKPYFFNSLNNDEQSLFIAEIAALTAFLTPVEDFILRTTGLEG